MLSLSNFHRQSNTINTLTRIYNKDKINKRLNFADIRLDSKVISLCKIRHVVNDKLALTIGFYTWLYRNKCAMSC